MKSIPSFLQIHGLGMRRTKYELIKLSKNTSLVLRPSAQLATTFGICFKKSPYWASVVRDIIIGPQMVKKLLFKYSRIGVAQFEPKLYLFFAKRHVK